MFASILLFAAAAAPPEELVVGARVMIREPKASLKVVDKIVGTATFGQPFQVSVLNGNWVGLSGQGYPFGFVERKAVVGLDQAVDVFSAAVIKEPKDAAAWLARGTARRLRGETDEALKDLDEAVRLAPTADARIARGNLRNDRGETAEALADYEAALKIAPKSPFALNNRGKLRADQGEWAAALADYDAALKELPAFGLALLNRGMARTKQKRFAEAIADYNEAIRLNPLDAAAQNAGAWLLATCPDDKFRNGKRALEMAARACALTSNLNWMYLDTLSAAHAEAGDFAKALTVHAQARDLCPEEDRAELDEHAAKFKQKAALRD